MNAICLTLLDRQISTDMSSDGHIVSLELGDAVMEAQWQGGNLHVRTTAQDIAAHDLSTHGAAISETLLARWDQGMPALLPQYALCLLHPLPMLIHVNILVIAGYRRGCNTIQSGCSRCIAL